MGTARAPVAGSGFWPDRKSTRLNSSHLVISYAVFCLKKKNGIHPYRPTRTHTDRACCGEGITSARDTVGVYPPREHAPPVGYEVFIVFFFFFNDTATTEIYTLSLHDALPI